VASAGLSSQYKLIHNVQMNPNNNVHQYRFVSCLIIYIGNQNLCVTFKFGLGTLSKQLQEIVRNVNKIKEKRKPLNFKLHLTTLDDANIHKSKH